MTNYILKIINSKGKALNTAFAILSLSFIFWTIAVWATFPGLPAIDENAKKNLREYKNAQVPPSSAFTTLVERNLFSPYRERRNSAVIKTVKAETTPKVAEPLKQKTPPPRLTLIGTILIGDVKKAILSSETSGRKSVSYKVGDDVEGFILKSIHTERVTLERDGEMLEVSLKGGAVSGSASTHGTETAAAETAQSSATRTLIPVKTSSITVPPPVQ